MATSSEHPAFANVGTGSPAAASPADGSLGGDECVLNAQVIENRSAIETQVLLELASTSPAVVVERLEDPLAATPVADELLPQVESLPARPKRSSLKRSSNKAQSPLEWTDRPEPRQEVRLSKKPKKPKKTKMKRTGWNGADDIEVIDKSVDYACRELPPSSSSSLLVLSDGEGDSPGDGKGGGKGTGRNSDAEGDQLDSSPKRRRRRRRRAHPPVWLLPGDESDLDLEIERELALDTSEDESSDNELDDPSARARGRRGHKSTEQKMKEKEHNAVGDIERATINISGVRFETFLKTLCNFPDTLLGTSVMKTSDSAVCCHISVTEHFYSRISNLAMFDT